ncbi:tetratricopeptide repeat protein [Taibaiella lutea]|uniref:Tetratricopeptide repeat protein n=1 Tax=Taibaiella lutea TaxID=2608001 RepID=A0A5M6CMH1_9BACT|nr:tetratricopeptide repeat protein [Taibaiella lutea]KAA5536408.1 tetratricopeptide repeat protein [Taibaiella lutea]
MTKAIMTAKKQKPVKDIRAQNSTVAIVTDDNNRPVTWITKLTSGYLPYVLLIALSFILYGNTLHYQYALDDEIIICKNEPVLKGLAGTSDIFRNDLFESYYSQNNASAQLSGGRYRPLSVFSFALEQEFIGTRPNANFEKNCWDTNENGQPDPSEDLNGDGAYNYKDCLSKGFTLRHFDNILFYSLTCCVLFLFLSTVVFREKKLLALIVCLLFVAHPLHTEVVANVKSRDEIFSFLFIILTLYFAHRYETNRKWKFIVLCLFSFFCALLSKEYGALLFVLLPLSLYLFSRTSFKLKNFTGLFAGMIALFGIYYFLRSGVATGLSNVQDVELLNNPYLLATPSQALATKLFVLWKYLWLCIFPYQLCSDYGYNSIPYKSFGDISLWISIFIFSGILVSGVIASIKKHWLAFAIAIYVLTLFLVSNLIFNLGATMGERLAFHASLGYCMVLGALIVWLSGKLKSNGVVIFIIVLPVLFLYSAKTISRNRAWENDDTLAMTDVKIMPESALLNNNAAKSSVEHSELVSEAAAQHEFLENAVYYGQKAVHLHPKLGSAYINLGLAYARLQQFDSSLYCLDKAFAIYPDHPNKKACYNLLADALYQKGHSLGATQSWQEGIVLFNKAIALNPDVAKYWYDLGGYLFKTQDFVKAKQAWIKAYQLDPNDPDIIKVQGILK